MNRFAIPVLLFYTLLTFAASPGALADDLFAFGDNLDKLAVGLSPEEVVALLGEPNTLSHTDSGLNFAYQTGDYAGVDIGFKKRATGPSLANIVFTDAFTRKTASGIGLGMHREQVQARIGAPEFEVDINTKFWESYIERGFVVHVEYNLKGVVTNLIKVDPASVDFPGDDISEGGRILVQVLSTDKEAPITVEGTYFLSEKMMHEGERFESRTTPFSLEIEKRDVVLLFHQLSGEASMIVKVQALDKTGKVINTGMSRSDVALMIYKGTANNLRITSL